MSIVSALYQHLRGDHEVTYHVGQRIGRSVVPQGTEFPYLTIQLLSGASDHHQGGATAYADSLVQVDVWARSTKTRDRIADAVRRSVDGFSGPMNTDAGSVWVHHCRATRADAEYPSADKREKPIYNARFDLTIKHAESVPVF